MRANAHSTGRQRNQAHGRSGNANPSALKHPATYSLALPRVSPEIKGRALDHDPRATWAKIALCWLDNGETLEDVPQDLEAQNVVQQLIQQWIAKHLDKLENLQASGCEATLDPQTLDWAYGSGSHGELKTAANGFWSFGVFVEEYPFWFDLKPKVEALEAAIPGLGETAMHYLNSASAKTLPTWTPNYARYICEYLYWYGQGSMDEFREEVQAMGEDDEDLEMTPDSFDQVFPPIARSPSAVLDPTALQALAAQANDEVKQLISVLLEIHDLQEQGIYLPNHEIGVDLAGMAAVFVWGEEDQLSSRIIDDHMESAYQCCENYTYLSGVDAIPFNDPEAFTAWKKRMEGGFALLKLLDRLIGLIAVPVSSN